MLVYFYLNKNNITMETFIDFVNGFKDVDDVLILTQIYEYNKQHKINPEWMNNKRLNLKPSLINSIKQILNNKLTYYSAFVETAKKEIFNCVSEEYDKIKNKDDLLLNLQRKYLCECSKLTKNDEELALIYEYDLKRKAYNIANNIIKKDFRNYDHMMKTKGFGSVLVYYSYICYFKCAVNCIIHHPLFKKEFNIDSESPTDPNNYQSFKLWVGGYDLWEMLKDKKDIISVVDTFNKMTNNKYLIGCPKVKYYPHQILQFFLRHFDNEFAFKNYCDKFFVRVITKDNVNEQINNIFKKCHNESIFIAPIANNPFDCYTYQDIINTKCSFNNPNSRDEYGITLLDLKATKKLQMIKDKNIKYSYDLVTNDYYLTSFCVIEHNLNDGLSFHCVFIQIKYDNNYKPIKINRYDNAKVNYRSEEDAKKYPYIINERNIFNDSFTRINDYYSGDNNFKICLLCYVKK